MDFQTIWTCNLGITVTVSNGKEEPQPSGMLSNKWKAWFSKNFTGVLVGKGTTSGQQTGGKITRWLRFEVPYENITTGFIISENMDLTYSSDELNSAALALYESDLAESVDTKATIKLTLVDAILIYAKWQEVRDINSFGLANAVALPANEREARFPFMVAEFNENPGMTPQEVLDRFEAQTQNKLIKAGKIEARRSRIKREIAAAATQAEKEAAAVATWDDI